MRSAFRSELVKITTVRGLWLGAVFAALVIPATSLLVVATGGLGSGESISSGAASGALIGLLGFGAWGATLAAGEYAQKTMIVSLATVPRRSVLFGAKMAAAGSLAAIGGLVGSVIAILTVLAIAPSGHHGAGNVAGLLGIALATVVVAIAGASVGMMTRSPVGSIGVVLAGLLLPKAAGNLLGSLQRWVIGASPSNVVTQMVGRGQLPSQQWFPGGPWAAAITMILVMAAVGLIGLASFARRDG
jgi:ABC-2 type transport system permease protein